MIRARERTITDPDIIFTDRRLATPEEIESHPYFTKFRALHALGPFLAGQLLPGPGVFAAISLQGQANRAPYTDEEIDSFTRIARHVERALMLTVKLVEAEALSETFADLFSKLSCGILLLDANHDLVFTNNAAYRMLGASLALKAVSPAIRDPHRKLVEQAISAAVSCTGKSNPVVPVLLPGSRTGVVIALYVMPFGQSVPPPSGSPLSQPKCLSSRSSTTPLSLPIPF